MRAKSSPQNTKAITLPNIMAIAVNACEASIINTDGELRTLSHEQAGMLIHKKPALVCHAPYTMQRLGQNEFYAFDILELFAFVHPAKFCVPTPHGLAVTLGLDSPESFEDIPLTLLDITKALLKDIQNDPLKEKADPLEIAQIMGLQGKGWPWTPFINTALGKHYDKTAPINARSGINIWKHLPEWAENAPQPPPSHYGVSKDEVNKRLQKLLNANAEKRQEQIEYAQKVATIFEPIKDESQPHVLLAEAGTGVGKTIGYLAPASIWTEKNQGTVWISTYTKNLQRQIDAELNKLYPNQELKNIHTAIRKGRENYLCLLNLEEIIASSTLARDQKQATTAGIMARWAAASKDGDLSGADFPGWLSNILGYHNTLGLADKRGECIYSACDHYHKCFIERSIRKAKHAQIVVANHALVMISAALSTPGEDMPTRYIFDEGHHLFDAADSAFAAHLTAREANDLRRWILGAEGGRQTRARGLKRRAEDLASGDINAEKALQDILHHATILSADGWTRRLKDSAPKGICEAFLELIYKQVYARDNGRNGSYSLETQTHPVESEVLEKAILLKDALENIQKPMQTLARILRKKLNEDDGYLDSDTRKRLDAVASALEKRAIMTLQAWCEMLDTLKTPLSHEKNKPDKNKQNNFIDWMEIKRIDGRAVDVGLYRHHINPMKPFAASIAPHVQGMMVTSATLRDETENWDTARKRTGVDYLTATPHIAEFNSSFDYKKQTKIFIINDVRKDSLEQVAGAYRALFQASNGGALGVFTAISRLSAVHEKIALKLEENGISLYSQHVDNIDAGTLVDIFRDDIHACLLGTDAIRDGVDVPGESLRMIVFDRVPWPRPTILHKARRKAFKGRAYDEMITRLKLKQAFGRLIRHSNDKGIFVMLDSMLPSRLQTAFPPDSEIRKTGLAETIEAIKEFL